MKVKLWCLSGVLSAASAVWVMTRQAQAQHACGVKITVDRELDHIELEAVQGMDLNSILRDEKVAMALSGMSQTFLEKQVRNLNRSHCVNEYRLILDQIPAGTKSCNSSEVNPILMNLLHDESTAVLGVLRNKTDVKPKDAETFNKCMACRQGGSSVTAALACQAGVPSDSMGLAVWSYFTGDSAPASADGGDSGSSISEETAEKCFKGIDTNSLEFKCQAFRYTDQKNRMAETAMETYTGREGDACQLLLPMVNSTVLEYLNLMLLQQLTQMGFCRNDKETQLIKDTVTALRPIMRDRLMKEQTCRLQTQLSFDQLSDPVAKKQRDDETLKALATALAFVREDPIVMNALMQQPYEVTHRVQQQAAEIQNAVSRGMVLASMGLVLVWTVTSFVSKRHIGYAFVAAISLSIAANCSFTLYLLGLHGLRAADSLMTAEPCESVFFSTVWIDVLAVVCFGLSRFAHDAFAIADVFVLRRAQEPGVVGSVPSIAYLQATGGKGERILNPTVVQVDGAVLSVRKLH